MDELNRATSFKFVHGTWDIAISGDIIKLGHVEVTSVDLARFLGASRQVVILAATLGTGVDVLLQRLMYTDMAEAVLIDSLASKLIEEFVNKVQSDMGIVGKRYSPGYGDFDIKHQKDILTMLKSETIGLYMTDSYMLLPSKSITAILRK